MAEEDMELGVLADGADLATSIDEIPDSRWHRLLGAVPINENQTRFIVWSPCTEQVVISLIELERDVTLRRLGHGYHGVVVSGAKAGMRYHVTLDGGPPRPDPASRFQPDGVHGPSQIVSQPLATSRTDWRGVPREQWVIYEIHLGTFTQAGTYVAAIERLDELVDLGITVVEIMPLADSAGAWNWGYDGVHWFAPRSSYGTPDQLRQFVAAAHQRGLAVILDVVYNHLGPEGNYWGEHGGYLSDKHSTVWGAAPNFDDPRFAKQVRRFTVANAVYWLDEYAIDGLRVDAIHCMCDESDPHIVAEISHGVRSWASENQRVAYLIAESNVYDPEMLEPAENGGYQFDGQWCDDFLHAVFATVRPGEQLCDRVYLPGDDLEQTLRSGYVYEGTLRQERERRKLKQRVDTSGLIYSIQNHDFIGNHPLGQRLHQLTSVATQQAAATLLLLSPAIPMLFMGEEFACEHPFRFFVDFGDEQLRHAVVAGRKAEYPQHDWSQGISPVDTRAFSSSKIGATRDGNGELRAWYALMLQLRRHWLALDLLSDQHLTVDADVGAGWFQLSYSNQQDQAVVRVRITQNAETEPYDVGGPAAGLRLLADSRPESPAGMMLPNHARVYASHDRDVVGNGISGDA